MHDLFERILKRHYGDLSSVPPELSGLFDSIDATYHEIDAERSILERSLELGSRELVQANSDMRALFQAFPDLFFRIDAGGRILDCRGGTAGDLLFSPDTLIGRRIQRTPDRAAGSAFRRAIERVRETNAQVSIAYWLRIAGKDAYYEARLLPALQDQIIVIVRNNTERKLAVDEIARQRTFLRQVIDLNPNIIFAKDKQGRFTLANQATANAYGTTVENLLGRTDADFNSDAEQVEHFRRDDLEVMDSLRDKLVPEEMLTDATGKVRWLQTIKRPIISADGTASQVLGVATDITQRKLSEENLRRRNTQILLHQAVLHELATHDRPVLADNLNRIAAAAAKTLSVARVSVWLYNEDKSAIVCECLHEGTPIPEAKGTTLKAVDYPAYFSAIETHRTVAAHNCCEDSRTIEFAPNYLRPLGITSALDVCIRQNGKVVGVVCHEHVGPRREWTGEEQHFAASIADLVALSLGAAAHRDLQEQLRQSQKMEAIGILTGGVSHDFNNLLTSILGYCDLALLRAPAASPIKDQVREIGRAAGRAAELARQLLAFNSTQTLNPRLLDLNEVVRGLDGIIRRVLGGNIEYVTLPDHDLPAVHADAGQLQQMLMSLVVNARDAMTGGGRLTIETANLDVDAAYVRGNPEASTGPHVVVTITDTGCGMDQTTLSRVYDSFYTTAQQGDGSHAGLATVYAIVRQNGGHMRIQSAPGSGTTMRILLPVARQTTAITGDAGVRTTTASSRNETVLLVEDEDQVRRLAEEILTVHGYVVLQAKDGLEALGMAAGHPDRIDLLVTDVVLPGPSGRKTYEGLLCTHPEARVLYMSGHGDATVARHGELDEAAPLLRKPFTLSDFLERVREALDGAAAVEAGAIH